MSDRRFKTVDLTKGAMFIALMAIGANLTAFITVGTVPLTFQTVIAVLAGILLGKKLGAFSMLGYFVTGLVGVPVFAGFTGGFYIISSPTFGFILSFIALAYAAGFIMEKTQQRTAFTYLAASLTGLLINYGIGVPYLYLHSQFILGLDNVVFTAIAGGMMPFFIKDLILVIFTGALAPQLLRAVNRRPALVKAS